MPKQRKLPAPDIIGYYSIKERQPKRGGSSQLFFYFAIFKNSDLVGRECLSLSTSLLNIKNF